jgi:hypothetical protein
MNRGEDRDDGRSGDMRNTRIVAVLSLATVMLVGLAGCSSSSSSSDIPSTGSSSSGSSSASAPSTAPIDMGGGSASTANAPVGMNQPTKSGDWALTVTKLEFTSEAGGAKAGPGKELAVVTFELTNNASKDAGIGQTDFKFAGTDGVTCDAVPTSGSEFIFNTPQPVKAGEKRTIKIAYEVNAGVKGGLFTFSPFSETGSATPAIINVN